MESWISISSYLTLVFAFQVFVVDLLLALWVRVLWMEMLAAVWMVIRSCWLSVHLVHSSFLG